MRNKSKGMLAGSISVCGSRSTGRTKGNVTRGILAAAAAILLASGCSTSASVSGSDDQVLTSGETETSTSAASAASSPATSSTLGESAGLAPASNAQTDSPDGGGGNKGSGGNEENGGNAERDEGGGNAGNKENDENDENTENGKNAGNEENDENDREGQNAGNGENDENDENDENTENGKNAGNEESTENDREGQSAGNGGNDETPLKQPVTFSGSGPDVIGIDPGSALDSPRWIMEVTHDGTGGFQVTAVDSYGRPTDQIVYTFGSYQGRSSFAFGRYGPPDAIEVVADGNWTLTFTDPRTLDSIDAAAGAVFTGSGNDVYRFETGGEVRGIEFVCEACEASINLYSLGQYDWREEGVLISELGQGSRFAKVVLVPEGTEYLEIALASNDPETGRFVPNNWSITSLLTSSSGQERIPDRIADRR